MCARVCVCEPIFVDILLQKVEDVNGKFVELDKLKASSWIVAEPDVAKQKIIKVVICLWIDMYGSLDCSSMVL